MYKVETLDNFEEVKVKFKGMNITESIIESLIRNGNVVSFYNKDNIVMYTVAMVISFSDNCTSAKVLAIWVKEGIEKKGVILTIQNVANTIWYSATCVEFLGFEPKAAWQELVAESSPFIGKIKHSMSTFAPKFIQLKSLCTTISKQVYKAELSTDTFMNKDLIDNYNKLSKYGFIEHINGVYTFPFLSSSMCKFLVDKTKEYTYTTNDLEASAYQMPEAVLSDLDPELYEKLLGLYYDSITPIARSMYYIKPDEVRSIQLAKYGINGINKGNWHFDSDSDITLVVSLSDTHTGGGTFIKPYGLGQEIEIPQLPAGHALLFRGKHYLHKGLEVTKGERNILVFWSMAGDC